MFLSFTGGKREERLLQLRLFWTVHAADTPSPLRSWLKSPEGASSSPAPPLVVPPPSRSLLPESGVPQFSSSTAASNHRHSVSGDLIGAARSSNEVVSGQSRFARPRLPRMFAFVTGPVKNGRGCSDIFPYQAAHTQTEEAGVSLICPAGGGGSTIKGPSSVKAIFHLHHICCYKTKGSFWLNGCSVLLNIIEGIKKNTGIGAEIIFGSFLHPIHIINLNNNTGML